MIPESDYWFISALSTDQQLSQRELSKKSGLSLGAVNLVLKRFVKKGWIKTRTLNGRTLQYILTPKGFEEKLNKTYAFVQRTYLQTKQFEDSLKVSLGEIDYSKIKTISFFGSDEVFEVIKRHYQGIPVTLVRVEKLKTIPPTDLFLNATSDLTHQKNEVALLSQIPEIFI